ncbi:chaplin [Streptomyces sp. NPDC051776]|uniref:chaplin n=1 Tax=Streptomyces sp. NPDC051776 TaxID=3155414 RepID=UPI00342D654E
MSRMIRTIAVTAAAGAVVAGGAGTAAADSEAKGLAAGSSGYISGNVLQIPIHAPINFCGNTIDGDGELNATWGHTCINAEVHEAKTKHHKHGKKHGKKHEKKHHKKWDKKKHH